MCMYVFLSTVSDVLPGNHEQLCLLVFVTYTVFKFKVLVFCNESHTRI